MNNIKMVDLHGQYLNIKNEVDKAIQNIIETTAFVKGPEVKTFENELEAYLDIEHVIACANGTDALQIALMALDLKPGDEVITSNFTFIATVEVIALLGLTPVLVDVDPDTFLIKPDMIEEAITPNTKAIIPVHLFGQNCDMDRITEIAKKYDLHVIEDAAQSIGSDFITKNNESKKSGTIGDIGCTSFFPSKNLGCFGDGGAIFTKNDKLADNIRSIANHGMKIRYHHDIIGVNSRLDALQAAILRVKLKHLDDYCLARQEAAKFYDKAFKNSPVIQSPVREENSSHVYHQYTLKIEDDKRNKLKDHLQDKNIPSMIYYPIPLHKQKAFQKFSSSTKIYPVSENLSDKVLSLPMHTELKTEQLDYITTTIIKYFENE